MKNVTEHLLHEKQKMIGWEADKGERSKAMTAHNSFEQKKKFTCHYCGRPGHLKYNCRKLAFELANFNAQKKENFVLKLKAKWNTRQIVPHLDTKVLVTQAVMMMMP